MVHNMNLKIVTPEVFNSVEASSIDCLASYWRPSKSYLWNSWASFCVKPTKLRENFQVGQISRLSLTNLQTIVLSLLPKLWLPVILALIFKSHMKVSFIKYSNTIRQTLDDGIHERAVFILIKALSPKKNCLTILFANTRCKKAGTCMTSFVKTLSV